MIADAVRVERSKVGGGGVQDVVLDLGVRGLGQVSLWKQRQPLRLMRQLEVERTLGSKAVPKSQQIIMKKHAVTAVSDSGRRQSHRRTNQVLHAEMSFTLQESTS